MARRTDALNVAGINALKPRSKDYKVSDGRGLYLLVTAAGGKLWRFNYRFAAKQKQITLGKYPDVSLKSARDRRDKARVLIADGVDPIAAKNARKTAAHVLDENSFEVIAREWYQKQKTAWTDSHSSRIIRRLERDVFPWLGKQPVKKVEAPEILSVVRRIEERGSVETAHRALRDISSVFRYAIATARHTRNPAVDLRGALPPVKKGHFPALTEPKEVGALLRVIDGYQGDFVTRCALNLSPLVFLRPGELRRGEWCEIDLSHSEWRIPSEKMKGKADHIVPLSRQAAAILEELCELTGNGRYLFPNARHRDRPMSENAVLAALRALGYDKTRMVPHGFRAMARTLMDEVLHERPELIEHQLAHQVRDPLGRAYNRTSHLPERRAMMQRWANYLDTLRAGADVVPISTRVTK
ncbi:MAG: integrase arm-type DNA-binding domain-containing protein [Gammaproteobacteria bacterium]|nr:integrase arm-type DNA-binding domain-containing protein [Gammaproteobacteria bacterium]